VSSKEAELEAARDTLAPSSFGTLGKQQAVAPAPSLQRRARQPLNTLGEIEGASATATLRPPGAVPPPPRGLPQPALPSDPSWDRPSAEEKPLPSVGATLLEQTRPSARVSSAPQRGAAASSLGPTSADAQAGRTSAVPAPGLYIADEPLEPRPPQLSLVTQQRRELDRMHKNVLVLGGLLLAAAGALVMLLVRRSEPRPASAAVASAVAPAPRAGCVLVAPPSRISPIERSVPISAVTQNDGTMALGIADAKASAAGWIYDPRAGEVRRKLAAPAGGGDVSHVTAADPLIVDRSSPDFAFAQTLKAGLTLGVGPTGLLRRGADGATGEVWALGESERVTPPRVASSEHGYFVAFRRGGAEGRIVTGWLNADGSASAPAAVVEGAPKSLGTPNVALVANRGIVLFSARADKTEPYRVFAARVEPGQSPEPARALDLPAAGGGAIAPSLVAWTGERYLVQWTDGNVGQYQVHVRLFDRQLEPKGEALLVSAKGANAGQGTLVASAGLAVSFFIQTTAGHDELWGAALDCR
jgi:hypothetical protein